MKDIRETENNNYIREKLSDSFLKKKNWWKFSSDSLIRYINNISDKNKAVTDNN